MFAALTIERDPLQLSNVPALIESWVQDAGGFAAFGALLWLIFGLRRMQPADRARIPFWQGLVFVGSTAGAFICYAVLMSVRWAEIKAMFWPTPGQLSYSQRQLLIQRLCLTIGGAFGLIAVGLPFLLGVLRLRVRRIFAISQLRFKEAVRPRLLYVFSPFVP